MDRLLDALKTEKRAGLFPRYAHLCRRVSLFQCPGGRGTALHDPLRAESVTVTLLGDRERTGGIYDVAQKVRGRLVRIAAERAALPHHCFAAARGKTGRCGSASSGAGFFRGTRSPLARRRMPFACAQQRTPMSRWNMRRHRSARCFALDSAAAGIFWCAPAICPDYEATIENVFERYEIPVFLNRSRDILEKTCGGPGAGSAGHGFRRLGI